MPHSVTAPTGILPPLEKIAEIPGSAETLVDDDPPDVPHSPDLPR
jgi:hypothetical protein